MSEGGDVVALLMTDVEGSTRAWAADPKAMNEAMARHHELVHGIIEAHRGRRTVDQGEGDSVFAFFDAAVDAARAAAEIQRALAAEVWPTASPIRVRAALHVGPVIRRDGNLWGDTVNACARLRALGAGGQTLLSAAACELVETQLPAGLTLRDLGEHRIKDIELPIRVSQLDIDGLPTDFLPLASSPGVRHTLPAQATPFIGREREVGAVLKLLDEHRLVTITGFGGMGKTRVAVEAAERLADRPGAADIWFVDLTAVTEAAQVPARIAEAMGVRVGAGDPAGALTEALRRRPSLLVLDNLEHVIDCAGFVATLVSSVGVLRVLATSREPLRVRAEYQLGLDSMHVPPVGTTLDALPTFEAARLFLDRAAAARPEFMLTESSAATLVDICIRLDGHPLALELAAARMRLFTLDDLRDRLARTLDVLAEGPRDLPDRQQTLRATIAWSVDLLSDQESVLLARLSVFPAPADLASIQAVCSDGVDCVTAIEALVEKSLVRVTELGGQRRFGLLISVRDFAAELLTGTERMELADRHARRYREVQQTWAAENQETRQSVAWDLPHIRAALAHLREHGPVQDEITFLASLYDSMGHLGQAADYLASTARVLAAAGPDDLAWLHIGRALAYDSLGTMRERNAECGHALTAARRAGGPDTLGPALVFGMLAQTEPPRLQELSQEFDSVRRQMRPDWGQQWEEERDNLTAMQLRFVDPAAAELAARRLMDGATGDMGRLRLGRILLDRGDVEQALAVLAPFQDLDESFFEGSLHQQSLAIAAWAAALAASGTIDPAVHQVHLAWQKALALGASVTVIACVRSDILRQAGDLDAARETLQFALDRCQSRGETKAGPLQWRLAVMQRTAGEDATAAALLEMARQPIIEDVWSGSLELLGCLTERAAQRASVDVEGAARVLACVTAHRGAWTLPFGMDAVASELAEQLGPTHPAAWTDGWDLRPADAW